MAKAFRARRSNRSMGSTSSDDEEWEWMLSPRADDQFAQLDSETQERLVTKLNEVVSSEWRKRSKERRRVLRRRMIGIVDGIRACKFRRRHGGR